MTSDRTYPSASLNGLSLRRAALALLAAWFLLAQSFSLAHASAYGDGPHEHDGVACAVTILVEDEIVPLKDKLVFEPVLYTASVSYDASFITLNYSPVHGRAPPPRGPPFTL